MSPRAQCTPALPVEIKFLIAQNISSAKALSSLLISDSTFCYICQPLLYRTFTYREKGARDIVRGIQWSRAIISNLRLALYVKEADFDCHLGIRNKQRGTAGGAVDRLFLDAWSRLENLRMFRLTPGFNFWQSESQFRRGVARLKFPHLESFEGPLLLLFLESNRNIKYIRQINLGFNTIGERQDTTCILPKLVCYWGHSYFLSDLDPEAPLMRLRTDRTYRPTLMIESLLRQHGARLRAFELCDLAWTRNDFKMIARLAPNLYTLQIIAHTPELPAKAIIDEMRTSNLPMRSLEFFQLIHRDFETHIREDNQELYVHQLHKAFPSLRLIQLSSYFPEAKAIGEGKPSLKGWRYNESSHVWIAPPMAHTTRRPSVVRAAIMTRQYDEALPEKLDIRQADIDWHFFERL